ncbi:MAG: PKD domain-containing protein, partial [Burkholderiales bacterium]|nr:PKD domain-containing protein [Anaerolineae bacterium]
MARKYRAKQAAVVALALLLALFVSACNLTSAPEEQVDLTGAPTNTVAPTRTLQGTGGAPTTLPIFRTTTPGASIPTRIGQLPPTSIVVRPPVVFPPAVPTSTSLPVSIVILSPIPGNIVAGNVQVIGAAIHPQFLQYQVEYGPDPNPGNLWYQASGVVRTPVLNGLLGIWGTNGLDDGRYQLRLRVFLRDGSDLSTIVNNIRVQNRQPTPVPSATPNIPRPIAAFTQDRTSGAAPLVVRFFNQSSGNINSYLWDFGDGGRTSEQNPSHTFRTPGIFNVTLIVAGPGGSSNVTRQINVSSPTSPVAAFTQDKTSGVRPLVVQFTDSSTGNITSWRWNFGDGTTSDQRSPSHTFNDIGTYNVILTVTGPGGASSVVRQITVQNPATPPPQAGFTTNPTEGNLPLTVQFAASEESSGEIETY